jgi:hypothetical protein
MKKPKSAAFSFSETATKPIVREAKRPAAKSARLAERVKRCYVRERTVWESRKQGRPVEYRPASSYDGAPAKTIDDDDEAVVDKAVVSVWHKIATALQGRDIHPETYIQIQFSLLTHEDRRPPEPHQLLTPACLAVWKANKNKVAEGLGVALRLQRRLAEQEFSFYKRNENSPEVCWERVLAKRGIELSALFRYCLAFHLGGERFTPIAERYEAAAMMQFERHRDLYQQIWGSFLPVEFAERSRQMYPELLAE